MCEHIRVRVLCVRVCEGVRVRDHVSVCECVSGCECVCLSVRVSERVLRMRKTPRNPRDLTEGGSSSGLKSGFFPSGL